MRLVLLALLLATSASAQTFRPAGGPWTRDHRLVGSAPDGRIFAAAGTRLGVTADGGRTWTVVSETDAPRRLAADGAALLGAFPDGVRRSTDGGATWTPDGLDGMDVVDVAADGPAYAITSRAAYRRAPSGGWTPLILPVPEPTGNASLQYVAAAGGTVAVAGAFSLCTYVSRGGLYRSLDGGTSWTLTTGGLFPSDIAVGPDGTAWLASTSGYDCIGRDGNPGALLRQRLDESSAVTQAMGDYGGVAVGESGIPVLSPGEATGNALSAYGHVLASQSFVIAESRGVGDQCGIDPPCYGIGPSGLFARQGARAFPTGFAPSAVRALAVVRDTLVVGADGAVYRRDADAWVVSAPLRGTWAFVEVPWEPGRLLAVSALDFNPSTVPGALWVGEPASPRSDVPDPFTYYASSAAVAVGEAIVSASGGFYVSGAVLRSTMEGFIPVLDECDLASLGVGAGDVVYAGAVDGTWGYCQDDESSARIFRSDDAGDTWTPDDDGMTARNVFAFAAIGTDPRRLDATGTSGGVFVRTPGEPWQADGLADRTVFTLVAAPAGLLAGTDDGLFLRDASGTWTRYGTGLDGRSVYAILTKTDAAGEWTGVGTDRGLYQSRAFIVSSEAPPAAEARLAVTTLPNPGRGARTVRVDGLREPATVRVLDLLGRTVADLGRHEPASGRLEVRWDASALPAGVYVVRVCSGTDDVTVRAVVTR